MTADTTHQNERGPGLTEIATLPLDERNERLLDGLLADMSAGSPSWRQRKRIEAKRLVALSQIAPRMRLLHLDLRTDVVALVELHDTPVPCRPPGQAGVSLQHTARLAIEYPEEILSAPIPGTRPIRVLEPAHVFHSNVGPFGAPAPALCLGPNVPRAFPLHELVLASYAALTLQAISLDTRDPAGVLNAEAALWWQANASRIPLCSEPFLARPARGLVEKEGSK